ncbi:MAG TPA: biotin/lipoyl-containing protein [Thermoanaerobaculia bacterium]|jgi:biotin carboxyl carrier protein|nr:biotin/lipoyl-containing protein [Thermoanaerobaculia bacterium]
MIELVSTDGEEAEIRIDGRTYFVPYVLQGAAVHFVFDGETYLVEIEDKTRKTAKRQRDHLMEAPMPGVVLKMFVKAGDVVTKGAPLLILEAMKMEHQIVAPRDGKIASVNCTEGELVQPGVELVTLEG